MFCLQATRPTVGTRRVVRSNLQRQLQLVGLLLAAGDDGLPVSYIVRVMYSPPQTEGGVAWERAYAATMRLVDAATAALPVWQCKREGRVCVGLDRARCMAWLEGEYGWAPY